MVLFSERYWFLDSCESFFMDFFFLNGHPDSSCKFTKGLSWLSITKFKEFLYEKIVYLCSLSDCLSSYWILLHNNKCRLMLCKWASFISLIFCSACELQFQNVFLGRWLSPRHSFLWLCGYSDLEVLQIF